MYTDNQILLGKKLLRLQKKDFASMQMKKSSLSFLSSTGKDLKRKKSYPQFYPQTYPQGD